MALQTKPASADRQLVVGDRSYTLRFSLRAMAALQDHFGLSSLDAVGRKLQDAENLGVNDMAALLWAGLRTHHRDTTVDDALDILDDIGMEGMQEALGLAMQGAMPEAEAAAAADEGAGDPQ
jgi:hypothetical protein